MHVYSIIIRIAHLRTFARVCIILLILKTKVIMHLLSFFVVTNLAIQQQNNNLLARGWLGWAASINFI